MKNILVPTDFSDHSKYAIAAALKMAKKHNAIVHYLHSIRSLGDIVQLDTFASGDFASTTVSTDQIMALIDIKTEEANSTLKELQNDAEDAGVKTMAHVKQQTIEVSVNELCDEHNIDLVIMGSHGSSGLSELLIGSNAQKVVRYSKVPVLILKDELKKDIENMVYASNFEEEEVNQNIPKVDGLSNTMNSELHFLFVNTPGYFEDSETTRKKMNDSCGSYGQNRRHIYNDFSVEDGILAFARINNMDAICITTHGYKALRRLFNNNVVEHLVNHSDRPVISFNMQKE